MKRVLILLLASVLVFGCAACGDEESVAPGYTYEIAMITPSEEISIDDEADIQNTWEGLRRYAEDSGTTFKYYEPVEDSDDGRLEQIDQAVSAGARVIVCTGDSFTRVVHTAQSKYEDVTFILVDAVPLDADGNTEIAENCVCISFDEVGAGFLAGYSAVMEGCSDLGFMAESKSASMKRYGYGFLQGAHEAAKERGWYVDINYHYFDGDETAAKVQKTAEDWYNEGTELIFACGSIFDSVAVEADIADCLVLSAGRVKNSSDSNIASVVKECGNAVYSQLAAYYNEELEGGTCITAGAEEDGITIDMKASEFQYFLPEEYAEAYKKLGSGKYKLADDGDAGTVRKLIQKKNLYTIDVTVL